MIDYKSYLQQLAEADRVSAGLGTEERSVVERLLDLLESHEQSEQELLERYREAAEHAPDKGVRFLMSLVCEDEERHHRLMAAMVEDVKSSVHWLKSNELPQVSSTAETRAELLAETDRFLAVEREGEEQLKHLKKEVKRLHAGLLELIVETMAADTHKHVDILKYIRKQVEEH